MHDRNPHFFQVQNHNDPHVGMRARYEPPEPPRGVNRSRVRSSRRFLAVLGAIVVAAVIGVSSIFSYANVEVTERIDTVMLDIDGIAYDDVLNGQLVFDLIGIETTATTTANPTEVGYAERYATGEVTVYNASSTSDVRLLPKTRFASPSGDIYFAPDQPLVIPGMEGETPGEVTITVTAESPGDTFNISESGVDFVLPGFKSTAKFETIYARTVTPVEGGSIGESYTLDDAEQERVQAELYAMIEKNLLDRVSAEKTERFVGFESGRFMDLDEVVFEQSPDSEGVTAKQRGSVFAVLFEKERLGAFIANEVYNDPSLNLSIENIQDLTFVIKDKESIDITSAEQIAFTLQGEAKLKWSITPDDLAASVAGSSRRVIGEVMSRFESVDEATVKIRPFWRMRIPGDPEKVYIDIAES